MSLEKLSKICKEESLIFDALKHFKKIIWMKK